MDAINGVDLGALLQQVALEIEDERKKAVLGQLKAKQLEIDKLIIQEARATQELVKLQGKITVLRNIHGQDSTRRLVCSYRPCHCKEGRTKGRK